MSDDREGEDYRKALGALKGKGGPKRRGLTTGSCAQAAALAAAIVLSTGRTPETVRIVLPASGKPWSGKGIRIPVASAAIEGDEAVATVIKDAGDDMDITNGMPVVARLRRTPLSGIAIRGGRGVGRVTRPGLPVPMGEAAINPVPQAAIRRTLEAFAGAGGLEVLLELPRGEELAPRTWNPRIGIEGGLSILGTSGVVEPASSAAFRLSIWRSLKAYRARGLESVWLSPGYVGEAYLRGLGVPDEELLAVGDHFGFALDACARLGFRRVGIAAHVGKLTKLAAGLFNTHARHGDARLETLAAWAGASGASRSLVERLLDLKLAEEAVPLLLEEGMGGVFGRIARRASERAGGRAGIPVACVMLNIKGSPLGDWDPEKEEL